MPEAGTEPRSSAIEVDGLTIRPMMLFSETHFVGTSSSRGTNIIKILTGIQMGRNITLIHPLHLSALLDYVNKLSQVHGLSLKQKVNVDIKQTAKHKTNSEKSCSLIFFT